MNAIEARALANKKNEETEQAIHEEMLTYVDETITPAIIAEAEKGNYRLAISFPYDKVRFFASAVRKELDARGYTTEYHAKPHTLYIVW